MNTDVLVRMANQIGQFFESQASRDEAIVSVRDHIRRFWDPRMRDAIMRHVACGGVGMSDVAREAVKRLDPIAVSTIEPHLQPGS